MAHEGIFLFSVRTNDGTTGGQYSPSYMFTAWKERDIQ